MNDPAVDASCPKKRILFACVGNTCRSLIAEFITRKKFGRVIVPASAGFNPGSQKDAESAIYTLRMLFDIDASEHRPRLTRPQWLYQSLC